MYKRFIITFGVVILTVIAIFFYFKHEVKEEKLSHILDQITSELSSELKTNEMDALEIAVVISKNSGLVDALKNDDEDLGYSILFGITKSIKDDTNRLVRAQVITSDYQIFARSWDTVYAGMPLGSYRTDLDYFKTHNTPRTSIEVGRRLGLKATVPIYKNKSLIGFVEIIEFFEPMTDFFRAQGIDLYVLMDDKYFSTAVFMQENLTINKYIVANINYNASHIDVLKKIDFKQLKADRIISVKGRHIFYETMRNGNGESIGAFVFVLPNKYLDYFRDPEDDISFLINVTRSSLYSVQKYKQYQNNMFDNYNAKEMVDLKNSVPQEDQEEFLNEGYRKLNKYSKDQLIELILEHKSVKKINGTIK